MKTKMVALHRRFFSFPRSVLSRIASKPTTHEGGRLADPLLCDSLNMRWRYREHLPQPFYGRSLKKWNLLQSAGVTMEIID